MGFKRLVSGIKESNRKGSLQIAYCWIKSWMYVLETREELKDSQNQFYHWLRSPPVLEELGDNLCRKLDFFTKNCILATHAHNPVRQQPELWTTKSHHDHKKRTPLRRQTNAQGRPLCGSTG
jgi:hypothetical protein